MAMTLRVMVPPHPLIAHWLTMLRNAKTPSPLFATGLEELGKWLTYEALRDWLPYREELVETNEASTKGQVIESSIPLLAIPIDSGGLQLWQGARKVLPNSQLCLGEAPENIDRKAGIIIYIDQIASGEKLLSILGKLKNQEVESQRIRVISALTCNIGLLNLGKEMPELNIYTSCIDPDITNDGQISPGIGNPTKRLNTIITTAN